MRLVSSVLGLVIACAMFASTGNAAVILSFGVVPTFTVDSGIQEIVVSARSSLPGGEIGNSFVADFTLSGGARFGSTAGTFGGPGFVGAGNILAFPSSSFDGFDELGLLNINYSAPQNLAFASTPLATLLINTAGLAEGSYTIDVTNGFFDVNPFGDVSGSFNVTAVPEPTSMAMAGLIGLGGVAVRRFRGKAKA